MIESCLGVSSAICPVEMALQLLKKHNRDGVEVWNFMGKFLKHERERLNYTPILSVESQSVELLINK